MSAPVAVRRAAIRKLGASKRSRIAYASAIARCLTETDMRGEALHALCKLPSAVLARYDDAVVPYLSAMLSAHDPWGLLLASFACLSQSASSSTPAPLYR